MTAQIRRFRDKKLEKTGHVQCARCALVFRPAQSDDDARAEEMVDFGENREDSQLVCEPCFKEIERETKVAEEEAKRKEAAKTAFTRKQRQAAMDVMATVPPDRPETLDELVERAIKAPGIELIRLPRPRLRLLMSSVRKELYEANMEAKVVQ